MPPLCGVRSWFMTFRLTPGSKRKCRVATAKHQKRWQLCFAAIDQFYTHVCMCVSVDSCAKKKKSICIFGTLRLESQSRQMISSGTPIMASIYQNCLGTNRQCYQLCYRLGNILFYTTFNIYYTTFYTLINLSVWQSCISKIFRKLISYLSITFGIYQVEVI